MSAKIVDHPARAARALAQAALPEVLDVIDIEAVKSALRDSYGEEMQRIYRNGYRAGCIAGALRERRRWLTAPADIVQVQPSRAVGLSRSARLDVRLLAWAARILGWMAGGLAQ